MPSTLPEWYDMDKAMQPQHLTKYTGKRVWWLMALNIFDLSWRHMASWNKPLATFTSVSIIL
jgi:hypothetical protein